MKRKSIAAIIMAAVMALSAISVLAQENDVPENALTIITEFSLVDPDGPGDEFAMESADGKLVIHITNDTPVYFEDYVPLCDECEELTRDAREVLFGRTLAEVLDGRELTVLFVESDHIEPISVTIMFVGFVTLPETINGMDLEYDENDVEENGYFDIMPLPDYIDFDDFEYDELELNGEVVVNGVILGYVPVPFLYNGTVMVPLRAVAEALDYSVSWNSTLRSVQLGVAIHIWIGETEVHFGRMAPIELSAAPVLVNNLTFVPLDFFRNVLGQYAYVFEGQVVVETYSDMA